MKHVWFQKKQTSFLDYKQKYRMGGKVMTKEEQLARFYTIYNNMSEQDKKCIIYSVTNILAGRIAMVWIFGIVIGIVAGIAIGTYIW
jgi:hypothetical protein